MDRNKTSTEKIRGNFGTILRKIFDFFIRWSFMISVIAAAIFCVFVWYRFVWKADWDEAKKQSYVNEQAKFSFDKAGYQKMMNLMKTRKNKLENFPKFTGRDVFFPEGF